MVDPPRPAHLADVYQALDAGFELDEGAIVHDVDDFALLPRAHRIPGFDLVPWIDAKLLETQGDFFLVTVDAEHLDFDFVVDLEHFGRMSHPVPAHVGNVQESINPTQVHKRPEVGDILDRTLANLSDFDFREQRFLGGRAGFLDELAA